MSSGEGRVGGGGWCIRMVSEQVVMRGAGSGELKREEEIPEEMDERSLR